MSEQALQRKTRIWIICGIFISWLTFSFFVVSPFGFLAWIGILIYLIRKRSVLRWYFIFSAWLFVPGCSFLSGTADYIRGTASIKSIGGPMTYHGIDQETRATCTSSGCMVVGYEPFVFLANNAAVRLWTNLFGYQRNAYTGVFPTEDEAYEMVKTTDNIVVTKTDTWFRFATPGQEVKVDTIEFKRFHWAPAHLDTVKGKVLNNECLLFQQADHDVRGNDLIYLADIKGNKILTVYFRDQ